MARYVYDAERRVCRNGRRNRVAVTRQPVPRLRSKSEVAAAGICLFAVLVCASFFGWLLVLGAALAVRRLMG